MKALHWMLLLLLANLQSVCHGTKALYSLSSLALFLLAGAILFDNCEQRVVVGWLLSTSVGSWGCLFCLRVLSMASRNYGKRECVLLLMTMS